MIIVFIIIGLCYLQSLAMSGSTSQNALDRMSLDELNAYYARRDNIARVIFGLVEIFIIACALGGAYLSLFVFN
jgi:hypothetical protein